MADYQTVSKAIIVTARCRRVNCASGLPGAWFCGSETRHYIAPRRLPGVMMSRGQRALRGGQPPGLCARRWRSPGWVGDLKGLPVRRRRTRFTGSRRRNMLEAARALTGRRSFSSSKRLRVRPASSHTESTATSESFLEAAPMSRWAATDGRRREKAGWMTSNDKTSKPAEQLDIARSCGSPKGFPRPAQLRRRQSCRSVAPVNRTWAASELKTKRHFMSGSFCFFLSNSGIYRCL